MRVLALGGGGPIGQATVARLRAAGDKVFWASRDAPPSGSAEGHLAADRAAPARIVEIVERLGVDTVIDLVAYTEAETTPLLTALDGRIQRYVLISSCDVYRNYALLHGKEAGAPDLDEMEETAPLRSSRLPYRGEHPRADDAPDRWMDDYDKIPVEEAVRDLSCDWTILRLPMVYGPGDRQRRFRWATAPMQAGAAVLEAPAAWLAWRTTYGFIENVGEAVALAARHPNAARAVFNVADEPAMTHHAWIDRFAAVTGWRGQVRDLDDPAHPFARAVASMDLSVPLRTSARRLFADLGYRPPVSPERAAELTLAP